MTNVPLRAHATHDRPSLDLAPPSEAPALPTAETLTALYRDKKITPREVTERAFAMIKELAARTPSMNAMQTLDEEAAMRSADASTRRYADGRAFGPLDGVPMTIKEETSIAGLPVQAGTDYMDASAAKQDAFATKRLRDAGAVILGHSMMTEFGMSPVGYSAKRVMPRNAHSMLCSAGGSTTGGGVSVATGLVPLAFGADGGGSIRIPAACNGIFGIKPTFGRISRTGDVFGGSMCHLGPLGRSARDLAVFVDAVAGEDENDSLTWHTPHAPAHKGLGRGVLGLRIGVPDSEWAAANPDVQRAGREALKALEKEGAILVPLKPTLFSHAPAIGFLTIAPESYAELLDVRLRHYDAMGPDLRFFLSLVMELEPDSYIDAQRLRLSLRREMISHFRSVDVIALPTLAGTAPRLTDAELREGFVDAKLLAGLCRFAFLANLTGLPAGTCPIGKDADGLPMGLQIVADAFDEAGVIQVIDHLERIGVSRAQMPLVSVDLLGGTKAR